MATQNTIKIGPWGGAEGEPWDFNPGSNTAIIKIVIAHGVVVDSVSFESMHANGNTSSSGKIGGSGGATTDTIELDATQEHLTSISGIVTGSGTFGNHVGSLTFHTNRAKYGPYGTATGTPFDVPIEYGQIVGFFGRADDYINALGIYVILSAI